MGQCVVELLAPALLRLVACEWSHFGWARADLGLSACYGAEEEQRPHRSEASTAFTCLALLSVVVLRVAFSTPRSRKDVEAPRRWRQRAALRRALQAPPQLAGFDESLRQLCISGVARAASLRHSIAIYVLTVVF